MTKPFSIACKVSCIATSKVSMKSPPFLYMVTHRRGKDKVIRR
nr:MAG TPA: hypothetical protein [Caudoviricetes sp.]